MIKKILVFCSLLVFSGLFAQSHFEYVGFIQLNDTSLISYKINFFEENGIVDGYSITDLGGQHETKSLISGTYDENTSALNFWERDIIYTKSSITREDFCFVNFAGKRKNNRKKDELEGDFRGLYKNGDKCIDGKISMTNLSSVIKRAEQLTEKIKKSRRVDEEIKDKIDLVRTVDSLNRGILNKNENLSVYSNYNRVQLVVSDGGKVDGDIIDLIINGKVVLKNYTLAKDKKEFTLDLAGKLAVVEIFAHNVGESAPNTVTVEISDADNYIRTSTNLAEGESTKISVSQNSNNL